MHHILASDYVYLQIPAVTTAVVIIARRTRTLRAERTKPNLYVSPTPTFDSSFDIANMIMFYSKRKVSPDCTATAPDIIQVQPEVLFSFKSSFAYVVCVSLVGWLSYD